MEMSDVLPYVCAILALLLIWQYHQNQILTGRIQAVDIFDRSGTRLYIYAVPEDEEVCASCQDTHGMAFLPSRVARKDFNPRRQPCANKGRCNVVMIGLYGAWTEARQVVQRLRSAKNQEPLVLSPEELVGLTDGNWHQSVSAATDRIAVAMLSALTTEKSDPFVSIAGYREVIKHAQEVRDLALVVPAYLRVIDLLARQGRAEEALDAIDDFEKRYPKDKSGPHYPTGLQRGTVSIMRSRLRTERDRLTQTAQQKASAQADALPTSSLA